jgi:AcrR family transcriptional regulator
MSKATPRKKPKQKRSRATVAAILEATAQLLVEGGYHNLSTNRIAETAGVSIGSLYQYFSNKEAVVAAVVEEFADRQFEILVHGIGDLGPDAQMEQSVRELVRSMMEAKRCEPELSKVLFEELPPVGQIDVLKEWTQRACELVYTALSMRADDVRPDNLEIAAYVLVTACHGIVHSTVVDRPELLENDALAEETAELILRYLQPTQ